MPRIRMPTRNIPEDPIPSYSQHAAEIPMVCVASVPPGTPLGQGKWAILNPGFLFWILSCSTGGLQNCKTITQHFVSPDGISCMFWLTCDCVLGMKMTHLYPRELQRCARPIPVLPAVPSTIVPPGLTNPAQSNGCVHSRHMHAYMVFKYILWQMLMHDGPTTQWHT